jgi:lipopolysaccharide export LptBFGC system permease protein LptF
MILATLLLLHGDDSLDLVYFWSSILIVLLPVAAFVAIGWWLVRMYRREHKPPV